MTGVTTVKSAAYLDYNATAPLRPAAREAAVQALDVIGNPSSVHGPGRTARRIVEEARAQVCSLAGAAHGDLVFTSGGTEANAIALRGTGAGLVVSAIEHPSVLDNAPGAAIVPVDGDGLIDLTALEEILSGLAHSGAGTMVSVMAANNETGVIQPIAAVADIAHRQGARLHVDAIQLAGKGDLVAVWDCADLMSLSGHKIGGPSGVGAVLVGPGIDLSSIAGGGGQERGRRAGTENLPGIAGFGAAAAEALAGLDAMDKIARLRDSLEQRARAIDSAATIHGAAAPRLPNTTCIGLVGISAETQVMGARSCGSCCQRWLGLLVRQGAAIGCACCHGAGRGRGTFVNPRQSGLGFSRERHRYVPGRLVRSLRPPAGRLTHELLTNMPTKMPIYLDYQATTPVDPRVMKAMVPWFDEHFGNSGSIQHQQGQEAEAAVETARGHVAALLNADPREIIFTSGATESNNLAIKGALAFHLKHKGRAHVITCTTEHKCVLESVAAMEAQGAEATVLPAGEDGLLDLGLFESALRDDTVLVSIMAANNEIGVLQPIHEIGALCRERGIWFHTDAAQAVAKVAIDVNTANIDLLSISGHKMYGPKGIGVLYVRRRPRVRLEPLFSGGGQERGLRSGTLPVPLCVGLGVACEVAASDLEAEGKRAAALRDRFLTRIKAEIPDVIVNGSMEQRLPGNLNMSFPNVDGARLLDALTQVSVSSGSACMSDDVEPSYVLRAIGVADAVAAASVRMCIGRPTTEEEVDRAVGHLIDVVRTLEGEAPLAAE